MRFLDLAGTEPAPGSARGRGLPGQGSDNVPIEPDRLLGLAPDKFMAKEASDLNKPGATLDWTGRNNGKMQGTTRAPDTIRPCKRSSNILYGGISAISVPASAMERRLSWNP
jgi:hypothetical protein